MKYDIDDVVTLEDGKEYYLIDKNQIDGDTYYYVVEYNENIDKMLDNDYLFLKEEDDYLVDVVDLKLIRKLYSLFLNKISN